MAILNFPTNPGLDQTYIANNVIYTWNGEYWEANTNSGFDSRYVEVSGDNMTGDLTLGPVGDTQLTLTAASGYISSAGSADLAGGNFSILTTGAVQAASGNWELFDVGATTQAASATFQGDAGQGKEIGTTIDGGCVRSCQSGSSNYVFEGYELNTVSPTFRVSSDGSAEFAGTVVSGVTPDDSSNTINGTSLNQGQIFTQVPAGIAAGAEVYGQYFGTESAVSFKADGSASFAGGEIVLKSSGQVYSNRTTANGACFYGNLNGTNTSSIFADGSATFGGNVNVGNFDSAIDDSRGIKAAIGAKGATLFIQQKQDGGNGDNPSWNSYWGATQTSTITCDGSATFASSVTVSPNLNTNIQNPTTSAGGVGFLGVGSASSNQAGVLKWWGDSTSENALLTVNVGSSRVGYASRTTTGMGLRSGVNGDKWGLNANGTASFAGTVTATVVPPSDARFKENITPAKPQLADVVALGELLKNYDWNDQAPLNEEIRSQRQLGLIAQEAEEVCPSIVKDIHRTKTVEVTPAVTGPKGRVLTEAVTQEVDDSYKGISQDALIMKLIGAVTELKAELDALKGA